MVGVVICRHDSRVNYWCIGGGGGAGASSGGSGAGDGG